MPYTICGLTNHSFVESIETKFISEIGLERNSENSIMEITGFDRYVMGGKVTVTKNLIICTYPEARILKRFQLRLIFPIFNQKVKIVFFSRKLAYCQKVRDRVKLLK